MDFQEVKHFLSFLKPCNHILDDTKCVTTRNYSLQIALLLSLNLISTPHNVKSITNLVFTMILYATPDEKL